VIRCGHSCSEGAPCQRNIAEHIRKGFDVSDWSHEIVDEIGRPVMTMPFSEAVHRADA
jgi:hypothetical protein